MTIFRSAPQRPQSLPLDPALFFSAEVGVSHHDLGLSLSTRVLSGESNRHKKADDAHR